MKKQCTSVKLPPLSNPAKLYGCEPLVRFKPLFAPVRFSLPGAEILPHYGFHGFQYARLASAAWPRLQSAVVGIAINE